MNPTAIVVEWGVCWIKKMKEEFKSIFLLTCTTVRQGVVYRTSNCAYRQMYKHIIQPIHREVICRIFNVLHGA
jgi:hypothetical protein